LDENLSFINLILYLFLLQ